MRVQRVTNEASRVRIEGVGDRLAELPREKFGDLVFESLAGLVGEREIARIGAGAKDMRVDQFERASRFAVLRACAARSGEGDQRKKCDSD